MGIFARVEVDNSIDLPHFPEEIDRTDMRWQSKEGLDVYGGPYRITSDGRLEERKTSRREKTDEEKRAEAEKWGFDSWDEYVQAYDDKDGGLVPDTIEYDSERDDEHPPVYPSESVVDDVWWGDYNMHGTFEFHQVIKRDPIEYETVPDPLGEGELERVSEYALDVYLEYEARFTRGDLDEIVFMGSRMGYADDPVEYALEQIEEWREWKEEND